MTHIVHDYNREVLQQDMIRHWTGVINLGFKRYVLLALEEAATGQWLAEVFLYARVEIISTSVALLQRLTATGTVTRE